MGTVMRGASSTTRFLQEENQRLLERNEELEEELAYLRATIKSLRGLMGTVAGFDIESDLNRLLNRIVYEAVRIVDAVEGSLLLVDEESQELVFVASRSEMKDELIGQRIPIDTGIAGWVVAHYEPVIANDVAQDERFSSLVDQRLKFTTRSLLAAPLVSCGRTLGVVELVNKFSEERFDERDVETLSLLTPIAALAIDLASEKG